MVEGRLKMLTLLGKLKLCGRGDNLPFPMVLAADRGRAAILEWMEVVVIILE